MGNVGGFRYIASLEAQAIEKTWKAKYSSMPEAIEEEKRLKALAEKKKKEYIAREEKLAEEKIQRKVDWTNNETERKKQEIITNKPIVEKCLNQIEIFKNDIDNAVKEKEDKINKEILELEVQIKALSDEKKKCETNCQSLGLFKFSAKKENKTRIVELVEKIHNTEDKKQKCAEQVKNIKKQGTSAITNYKNSVEEFLAKKYNVKNQFWKEKLDIEEIIDIETSRQAAVEKTTQAQVENYADKLRILNALNDKNVTWEYSDPKLEEIQEKVGIDSRQRTSALVRQLREEGYVYRTEIKGMSFFKISSKGVKKIDVKRNEKDEYTTNKTYANLNCPEPPTWVIEKVLNKSI